MYNEYLNYVEFKHIYKFILIELKIKRRHTAAVTDRDMENKKRQYKKNE